MPSLWLAQLLCPQRHAIFALAYDQEVTTEAAIEAQIQSVRDAKILNPWCGLCASRDLHVEHGKLRTNDWDEATTLLRDAEAMNIASRAILGESGRN